MEAVYLSATQFVRAMTTGRTRPLLFVAEDTDGNAHEVIVKFRRGDFTHKGQVAELISALLASRLGLAVPTPAIVEVPAAFAELVPDSAADAVRDGGGPNFGSVLVEPGHTTWPQGTPIRGRLVDLAAEVFAFDLLVQNPDRRRGNPNLLARSESLVVIDHDQAFSFLYLPMIGGAGMPWEAKDHASDFGYMRNHLFYSELRGSRPNLGPFLTRLHGLQKADIRGLVDHVPEAWLPDGHDLCGQIIDYLATAAKNASEFIAMVRHLLE